MLSLSHSGYVHDDEVHSDDVMNSNIANTATNCTEPSQDTSDRSAWIIEDNLLLDSMDNDEKVVWLSDDEDEEMVLSDDNDVAIVPFPTCNVVVGNERMSHLNTFQPKRVGFSIVTVREYSVTVGSTSGQTYSCPIELDWNYTDDIQMKCIEYESIRKARPIRIVKRERRSRIRRQSTPRRLSLHERIDRIAAVQDIATWEVQLLEIKIRQADIDDRTRRRQKQSFIVSLQPSITTMARG
jgi:hypothetical protein